MNILRRRLKIAGMFVTHRDIFFATAVIDLVTGLIIELRTCNLADSDLDLRHCVIFPGFINLHCHTRQCRKGLDNHKETYATAGRAAIHGGVVLYCDMGNKPEAPTTDEIFLGTLELTVESLAEVILYAAIGPDTNPLSFEALYKAFMGPTTRSLNFPTLGDMRTSLRKYVRKKVTIHLEHPELMLQYAKALTHEDRRPNILEVEAFKLALAWMLEDGWILKFPHVSTHGGRMIVREAKLQGMNVTAEATPHHQGITKEWVHSLPEKERWRFKVNPPVRSETDRASIVEGLRDGDLDFYADDHAGHTIAEKTADQKPGYDEKEIPSGMPEMDNFGPFLAHLVHNEGFSLNRIAQIASYGPARYLDGYVPKDSGTGYGKIEVGAIGSFSVMNLHEPYTLTRRSIEAKCGWSPFENHTFPGRVVHTIVRGKVYSN